MYLSVGHFELSAQGILCLHLADKVNVSIIYTSDQEITHGLLCDYFGCDQGGNDRLGTWMILAPC